MILTVGLGLSRTLSRELNFSSDLILSEKAYFGAESGVEKALLELKNEPTQNFENVEILTTEETNGTSVTLDIENLVENFSFELAEKSSAKFWLRRDTDPEENFSGELVKKFEFVSDQNWIGNVQWKIQCGGQNGTDALIGKINTGSLNQTSTGFLTQTTTQQISGFLATHANDNCSLSLINLAQVPFEISVTAENNMPPREATIRAVGTSGGRKKVVEFQYRQKNLSPFFDFGLLHTE